MFSNNRKSLSIYKNTIVIFFVGDYDRIFFWFTNLGM